MSDASLDYKFENQPLVYGGGVTDYIHLLKPRVMSLVVFTSFVGLIAAPSTMHPFLAVVAILAIAIGAGASGALNMWYDADIDGRMQRTAARPIPRGQISKDEALTFGVVLATFSVVVLGLATNWVAAFLLAITIGFYLFVYTMWLKRRTPYNIVIGGAAGSFPPMIGWAAVTGSVSLDSVILFLIIFMWTPPHFWALSLYRCRDYERVNVPMLPVVEGRAETKKQIWLYSLVLILVSFLPLISGLGGLIYFATSFVLGSVFLRHAYRIYKGHDEASEDRDAKTLFLFSIFYLFMLFLVLLLENGAEILKFNLAAVFGVLA